MDVFSTLSRDRPHWEGFIFPDNGPSPDAGIAAGFAPDDGTISGLAREVQMKTVHRNGRAGRPPTGRDPPATTRMPATLIAEVEAWATANDATRSAAIRRLLQLGLTVRVKPTQLNATRAKELAANAIDNMADGAASADDRASRKRRLLKGPEEFREARVDRPKAKK